jgi:hypothetical protein
MNSPISFKMLKMLLDFITNGCMFSALPVGVMMEAK